MRGSRVGLGLVAALALVAARRPRPAGASASSTAELAIAAPRVPAPVFPGAPASSSPPIPAALPAPPAALPGSLEGTEPDGALRVDAAGELVIEPAVLRFFDYFLAATGEESPAAIRARIEAAIAARVSGAAAARARGLLATYLAYREAAADLAVPKEADAKERLAAVRALRRRHFAAADADALFGKEEDALAIAAEEERVRRDPRLSPEERKTRLAALEDALPEADRAARAAAFAPHRQREEEAALRARGATDDELFAQRVATVGEAAALRLRALDEERAAFARRVEAYTAARAAIEASAPPDEAREARLADLLARSFTPAEQVRVAALARRSR